MFSIIIPTFILHICVCARIGNFYWNKLTRNHLATAFESFQLGAGHPTEVAVYTRSFPMPTRKTSSAVLNTEGEKVWRPDGPSQGQCIWEMHGVWGWDVNKKEAVILRQNYFVKHPMTGQKVGLTVAHRRYCTHDRTKIDWYDDFFYPFIRKWEQRVRGIVSPEKILFIEVIPNEVCLFLGSVFDPLSHYDSFVPSLSPPKGNCRTWFMHRTGKRTMILRMYTC